MKCKSVINSPYLKSDLVPGDQYADSGQLQDLQFRINQNLRETKLQAHIEMVETK